MSPEVEDVFRSFTQVKVLILHCKNTSLHKMWHITYLPRLLKNPVKHSWHLCWYWKILHPTNYLLCQHSWVWYSQNIFVVLVHPRHTIHVQLCINHKHNNNIIFQLTKCVCYLALTVPWLKPNYRSTSHSLTMGRQPAVSRFVKQISMSRLQLM